MNKLFAGVAAAAAVACSFAARADQQVVEAYFLNHLPHGHDTDTIDSASMDDPLICIVVHGTELAEGDHEYHLSITDGRNHPVLDYRVPLKAFRGIWAEMTSHRYARGADAPGTWSFTAEIDGKQVLERDIEVAAPSQK